MLQQLLTINQLDVLVKFILQVFKWYMFPGIVLTMTFSILPINQEGKWKVIHFFTYSSHKLYNMWIYFSTRNTNVQLEYCWLNPNLFHQVSETEKRQTVSTRYSKSHSVEGGSTIGSLSVLLASHFREKELPVCFDSLHLNTSTPPSGRGGGCSVGASFRRDLHIMLHDIWRHFIQSNILIKNSQWNWCFT